MKKVLVIAPYVYLPSRSGGQKFIAGFLKYLGNETDLTVVAPEGNDWSQASSCTGISMLKKSFSRYFDLSLVNKIASLINEKQVSTLIIEHPYLFWLASRLRKKTGVRVIIHTHNIEYQRFRSVGKWWWPLLRYYERKSFRKSDGLFFITPEDRLFATEKWGIDPEKCTDVPFGIETESYPADRAACRKLIADRHGIAENETIISFNGVLNYKPNLDAVHIILEEINPALLSQKDFRYKIIISGNYLPVSMKGLSDYKDKNIIYTGFAEDISVYLKATDIFLNPVQSGGGIKTKIVEAIAYGAAVISTQNGAAGLHKDVCGNNLTVTSNDDWNSFTAAVLQLAGGITNKTPDAFYGYYQWKNIMQPVIKAI